MMKLYQLPLVVIPAVYARDYAFEAYVSRMFLSGTVDQVCSIVIVCYLHLSVAIYPYVL